MDAPDAVGLSFSGSLAGGAAVVGLVLRWLGLGLYYLESYQGRVMDADQGQLDIRNKYQEPSRSGTRQYSNTRYSKQQPHTMQYTYLLLCSTGHTVHTYLLFSRKTCHLPLVQLEINPRRSPRRGPSCRSDTKDGLRAVNSGGAGRCRYGCPSR